MQHFISPSSWPAKWWWSVHCKPPHPNHLILSADWKPLHRKHLKAQPLNILRQAEKEGKYKVSSVQNLGHIFGETYVKFLKLLRTASSFGVALSHDAEAVREAPLRWPCTKQVHDNSGARYPKGNASCVKFTSRKEVSCQSGITSEQPSVIPSQSTSRATSTPSLLQVTERTGVSQYTSFIHSMLRNLLFLMAMYAKFLFLFFHPSLLILRTIFTSNTLMKSALLSSKLSSFFFVPVL